MNKILALDSLALLMDHVVKVLLEYQFEESVQ